MGPGNRVSTTPPPLGDPDRKYWSHDVGYGKIGPQAYFNYNAADEQLLRTPSTGWSDTFAKGVFFAKDVFDVFNTPTWSRPLKPLRSKEREYRYDASGVPFRDRWRAPRAFRTGWSSPYANDIGDPTRHRGQPGGGTQAAAPGGAGKGHAHLNTRTRIEKY